MSDDSPVDLSAEESHELLNKLARERNALRTMIDLMPTFVYAKDIHSRFIAANAGVAKYMGTTPEGLVGKTDFDFYPRAMAEKFFADEQNLIKAGVPLIDHEELVYDKERDVERIFLTSKIHLRDAEGNPIGVVGTGIDITEHKAAEKRVAAGERLESIGRLAAGVAHEINTPIQFLKDTLSFLTDGMREMSQYIDQLRATHPSPPEAEGDFDELRAEMSPALDRMSDGLARIAEIVRSMKEFSHTDRREMSPVDLNRAIKSTLVIARSEYRYVADVETVLAPLPPVVCHGGQISQVVLNLVVNAAHAIGDAVKDTGARGKITVSTRIEGDRVVIAIEDTGGGIPDSVAARIFEPFFTTKEIGRGTGQGLSIARNAVVKDHGGSLDFETQPGKGTTFFVRLPLEPRADESLAVTGT
jgi:PAS domain S-box-containing protein